AAQRRTARERALGGALQHWPVGHRVTERHTDLDEIGAGAVECFEEWNGPVGLGIAEGQIRNESRSGAGAELGKSITDARHRKKRLPLTDYRLPARHRGVSCGRQ